MSRLVAAATDGHLRLPADMEALPVLRAVWLTAVEPNVARHVQPLRLVGGVLRLNADSPVWASRVRHQQDQILARLKTEPAYAGLTALRVRVAPLEAASVPRSSRPPPKLSAGTRRLLDNVADDVSDPALQAALRRLGRSRS